VTLVPRRVSRLVGCGAVVGAILWPVALADMAATVGLAPRPAVVPLTANPLPLPIGPLALAVLLFAAVVATLELRATTPVGLSDLVGDLSIATAAAVFLVAATLDAEGLLGPGFVVLCVGSVVFGLAGLDGKRRPPWGSALVAVGGGGLLASLIAIGSLGPGRLEGVTETALLSLLLYSAGWAWLGVHLALPRPSSPPPGGPS